MVRDVSLERDACPFERRSSQADDGERGIPEGQEVR